MRRTGHYIDGQEVCLKDSRRVDTFDPFLGQYRHTWRWPVAAM